MTKLSLPLIGRHIIANHKDILSKPCTEADIVRITGMYSRAIDTLVERHGYTPSDAHLIMHVEYVCLYCTEELNEFINWELYDIEP